jgi:hypothetical protein
MAVDAFDRSKLRRVMQKTLFAILLLGSAGCTMMVPRDYFPGTFLTENSGDPVKVVSLPLPAIATSPNEGVTYGALNAFLIHDKKDEVTGIVAPQFYYNENFGYTSTVYGTFYPNPDRNWEINLSKSTRINENFEIKVRDNTLRDNKLEVNALATLFTDGSARFFGFQSKSEAGNETNYANSERAINVSVGRYLSRHLQLAVGERFRDVSIERGAVKNLPFIGNRFSAEEVPGINGFTAHAQRLALIYNSTDSTTMPASGLYGRLMVETSLDFLGSSADYRHYEVEFKGYFPARGEKYITVFRLAYNQTLGSDVPFLERSILGGENSLRGYGRNRFVDNSYVLLNIEERIRLFRWRIFNVNADFEVAPFLDVGAVSKELTKFRKKSLEFNPGIGLRGVVRPNVVGRIDIGVGREGVAVFVGLGYPF